jgi:hypothetical protein
MDAKEEEFLEKFIIAEKSYSDEFARTCKLASDCTARNCLSEVVRLDVQ